MFQQLVNLVEVDRREAEVGERQRWERSRGGREAEVGERQRWERGRGGRVKVTRWREWIQLQGHMCAYE